MSRKARHWTAKEVLTIKESSNGQESIEKAGDTEQPRSRRAARRAPRTKEGAEQPGERREARISPSGQASVSNRKTPSSYNGAECSGQVATRIQTVGLVLN